MLSVILYQNIEELSTHGNSRPDENLFICPGPLIADGVRSLLGNNANVVTIAKWVGDQLKAKNQKRIMKSELLLRLSSVWRHYFPEAVEEIFFRAFEIFTDLRSFTLDKEMLQEVLAELDHDLQRSVLIFWLYFESEKLVDEQLAYKIASEDNSSTAISFVGFKHMNAIQIDMIKTLSDFKDVFVFFPLSVYRESLPGDWIRWILEDSQLVQSTTYPRVKSVLFQKNRLNQILRDYHKAEKVFDIVIPASDLELAQYQEVLNRDVFFKTNIDLFITEREKVFSALGKQQKSITEILSWIESEKKEVATTGNFRAFKIYAMIEESLEIYQELTSTLDGFFISVLKQVVTLNSPRNFISAIQEGFSARVLGLEEYRFVKGSNPIAIIASGAYGSLTPKNRPYNEKILKALAAIGPLKRGGLDFLFAKEVLQKILSDENSVLFLEEGLVDTDQSWREVLKNYEIETCVVPTNFQMKKVRDVVKNKIKSELAPPVSFSASRLQIFMDCPRKYYFSYIEKIQTRPNQRLSLDADEKGVLEHKIIETYFQQETNEYNFELNSKLCRGCLKEYLAKNELSLNKQLSEEVFYELLEYTKNGINTLLDYKDKLPGSYFKFEEPLLTNNLGLKGSIDCILIHQNEIYIFDFKRSSSSIGSKKELLDFEKIQLWIYRWTLARKFKVAWWGYINLSDGTMMGIQENEFSGPEVFENFLIKLVDKCKSEKEFAPNPRTEKVCSYCELQLFCPKEKIS